MMPIAATQSAGLLPGRKIRSILGLTPNNNAPALYAKTTTNIIYTNQARGQLQVAYAQSPAEIAQMARVNPQNGQGMPVSFKNVQPIRGNHW
jgi:hypothetical protein